MTANRIKEVALLHFSRYGYKGTSLTNIAKDVGIKKPSIYAHFKGKEELYFICLEEALQKDLQYVRRYIEIHQEDSLCSLLHDLLVGYGNKFHENTEAMFWLRSSFFPPDEYKDYIVTKANEYIAQIGNLLFPVFQSAYERREICNMEIDDAIDAYLCLFDGLMVELMYTGSTGFQKRLHASWNVFWRGIRA
ncbi:TetR/AcrR family transcriptional regulator [Microbacteriaceae bacterium 4G12]